MIAKSRRPLKIGLAIRPPQLHPAQPFWQRIYAAIVAGWISYVRAETFITHKPATVNFAPTAAPQVIDLYEKRAPRLVRNFDESAYALYF